jgi:putative transcriptional regulator
VTSLRGKLLVASPELLDPNFSRSVILVLDHTEAGAFGLVLNRPLPVPLGEVLPAWVPGAAEPRVCFVGGPVAPDAAIGLGRVSEGAVEGFAPLIGDLGTVDLELDPDRVAVDRVRVFLGHSGWGPWQLDQEVAGGSWFVVDSSADDPWSAEPEGLWRVVLRRQPGRLRVFADMPVDVGTN